MPCNRALAQAVLLALLLAGSAGALARQSAAAAAPPEKEHRGQHEDLPESVRRVERETGGEVLRAEPMQRDGREVYRFKVLTADGRVRVMQDDPDARRANPPPAQGNDGNTGNGSKNQKRPSRDPDGEQPQF